MAIQDGFFIERQVSVVYKKTTCLYLLLEQLEKVPGEATCVQERAGHVVQTSYLDRAA